MGKFANTAEEAEAAARSVDPNYVPPAKYLGPRSDHVKLEWNGENGFEAMGHAVPAFRKTAGEAALKDMGFDGPTNSEKRYDIVARMSSCIERDNSHEALELALKEGLDVTGCYRLLAVLLCEPEKPVVEASYIDLVTT